MRRVLARQWRRVPARQRGRLIGMLVGVATVCAIDSTVTVLQGEAVAPLLVRLAVLMATVPGIAWYVIGRLERRSVAIEQELLDRQESLLRNISDLVLIVDDAGLVRYQSPSIERALGYTPDDLLGTRVSTLVTATDGQDVDELLRGLEPGARAHLQGQVRQRDGRFLAVDLVATGVSDRGGVDGHVLTMHDVSRWKELEDQLTRQALHDPLTGLPNRVLYGDRLAHALGRRRRHAGAVGVLFLDLDDFKTVNDSLGHAAGDRLICDVADRLQAAIRPGDTAARLGGDEFALLLEDVDEAEAVVVADRVLDQLERPFDLGDRSLLVGASLGIALSSPDLPTAPDLLRAADTAMYQAKAAGKRQHRTFEPSMHLASSERLRLGADLRGAVELDQFVVHYQPIVALPGGETVAMEALVRWEHPDRGLLAPGEFIPLAEQSGLIVPIGERVLREACRQARGWQLGGGDSSARAIGISVNVSAIQLAQPGFVASVLLALEDSELAPGSLTLEITESVVATDDEAIGRRLRQLRGIGVRLSIDDFGTGFSSLGALARLPVDEVKIDRRFVAGAIEDAQQAVLLRSIVRLVHSLKLSVIAEGVEQEEQVRLLRAAGCDQAQGFRFARPMDARTASEFLLGHATLTMWVGHAGRELEVIEGAVRDFEVRHPRIRVDVLGGVGEERLAEALVAGRAPNVVTSFESSRFVALASTDGLLDLTPYLVRDEIDEEAFVPATAAYTRPAGRRWALPMLADAYGLYYNRGLFRAAGLDGPPRTLSELTEYAKKLTRRRSDGSLEVVGFNPLLGFYENSVAHFGHLFGAVWPRDGMTGERDSGSAPFELGPWARMLRWQKALVDWYGFDDLVRFGRESGEEFSPDHAFQAGRLAMSLDGEWRLGFIASSRSSVEVGTAPLPVDDTRPDLYGSGYINGTVIGIPPCSPLREQAWELVKYLATDEAAVVKLANGLRNVPSIRRVLESPDLGRDPNMTVFLDIFAHPRSSTPPMTETGTAFEIALGELADRWQTGRIEDLEGSLLVLAGGQGAGVPAGLATEGPVRPTRDMGPADRGVPMLRAGAGSEATLAATP